VNGRIETAGAGQAAAESSRDVLDHRAVAWERVRWTSYLVHQHFRYEYPTRIHDLRHRLVIVPPEQHGDQRLITHRLDVSSPTTETRNSLLRNR